MNKRGVGPIVATALLLVVAVVAFVSFQSWYASYQDGLLLKSEKGKDNVEGIRIEMIRGGSNSVVYVKNSKDRYSVLSQVKINKEECSLLGSDIIGENSVTEIDTDCSVAVGDDVDVLLVTNNGIFSAKTIAR